MHLYAQRVRGFVEPSTESAPLKDKVPAAKPAGTTLVTDVFHEDSLRAAEQEAVAPKKAETLAMLHERLLEAKAIGNPALSCCGKTHEASPQDLKTMLADSTAFYSLGFGRFFTSMGSRHLVTQDLRHLGLLGLFHRMINDTSFRRQTKTDSAKSLRQIGMENAYGTPLMAAFRGVLCTVFTQAPLPAPVAMRSFETFTKAMQAGKTVAQSMQDVLCQSVDCPEGRYMRLLEGGIGQPTPPDATGEPEDLLPLHSKAAYAVVGVPWTSAEDAEADKGGKKKK